jgi:hypothetical protein
MKDDDMDDVFDSEDDGDEPEVDIAAARNRPINWRRIELAKEKIRLRRELSDYDDMLD